MFGRQLWPEDQALVRQVLRDGGGEGEGPHPAHGLHEHDPAGGGEADQGQEPGEQEQGQRGAGAVSEQQLGLGRHQDGDTAAGGGQAGQHRAEVALPHAPRPGNPANKGVNEFPATQYLEKMPFLSQERDLC